jgi:cytochrome c oxidase subunit 2
LVGWPSLVRKPATESSSRPRAKRAVRALGYFVLASFAAIVMACSTNLPQGNEPGSEPPPGITPVAPVTESGQATLNLYLLTFVIAVVVFFIVEGLLVFITLRFRRKPGDDTLPKQTHGNNPLEILWTLVPAVTVTAIFAAAFLTLTNDFHGDGAAEAADPAVTIDVTGFQWQWTFAYEEQGIKLTGSGKDGPVMGMPVNETVHIRLHASDVIHSFYVPQFLYKKDVVPGRTNEFDVVVEQPGTYAGQCAEFCGIGHADMHFTVQAMTPDDFNAWIAQQQAAASAPPPSQAAPPPGAPTVQVDSVSITAGFDPSTLSIPANTPWTVQFTNSDPSVPHNFSIHKANADGGQSATYNPPPLPPGTYQFFCGIHPNMVGTLNVQ